MLMAVESLPLRGIINTFKISLKRARMISRYQKVIELLTIKLQLRTKTDFNQVLH